MHVNPLWSRILRLLPQFRKAFSRHRTFLWFCCLTLATVLRTDLLGVTSFARSLGGKSKIYDCLLGLFASGAVKLGVLSRIWAGILATHKLAIKINGRILLIVDGIKAPRSGRQMAAVKKLFQHSSSNTEPAYISPGIPVKTSPSSLDRLRAFSPFLFSHASWKAFGSHPRTRNLR